MRALFHSKGLETGEEKKNIGHIRATCKWYLLYTGLKYLTTPHAGSVYPHILTGLHATKHCPAMSELLV